MNNQQNKPQDNQKVEKAPKQVLENINNSAYVHKSDCIKAMKEYAAPLKSRIAELEKQNEQYREALEDIVTPIAYLRKGLKDGEQLNGYYAAQLAKDPAFLKQIAEQALKDNG